LEPRIGRRQSGGLVSISQGCDGQARISCQPIRCDSLAGRAAGGGTETKATLEPRQNRQANNATSKDATGREEGKMRSATTPDPDADCSQAAHGACAAWLVAVPDREKNPMLDAHGTTSIVSNAASSSLGRRRRTCEAPQPPVSAQFAAAQCRVPWERGKHPRGRAGNRGWEAVGNGKHQGQRLDARGRCSTRGQKRERKSRSLGQRDNADGSQGRTWQ
jgi:hypothetical protein